MRAWFPWLRPATNPVEISGDVSELGPSGNGFASALKVRTPVIFVVICECIFVYVFLSNLNAIFEDGNELDMYAIIEILLH